MLAIQDKLDKLLLDPKTGEFVILNHVETMWNSSDQQLKFKLRIRLATVHSFKVGYYQHESWVDMDLINSYVIITPTTLALYAPSEARDVDLRTLERDMMVGAHYHLRSSSDTSWWAGDEDIVPWDEYHAVFKPKKKG